MRHEEKFNLDVHKNLTNNEFRERIDQTFLQIGQERAFAESFFSNLELAKTRAAYIKWKVNENLDKYLIDFEASIVRKGGKVVWAFDASIAVQEVEQILKKTGAKRAILGGSSIANEIDLVAKLAGKAEKLTTVEVGSFILHLASEKPFHSAYSTMRKDIEEVKELMNKTIRTSLDAEPEELLSDIRMALRNEFYQADVAITAADFLIADSGLILLGENDGGSRLGFAFAKTHIVLAGIDKILPSINDADLFMSLHSAFSAAQQLKSYQTFVGPKEREDNDSPAEFIVILIDNGRSNVLAAPDQRQALSCIECGACSEVCPVFTQIGGSESYPGSITGPIGMVMEPLMEGLEDFHFLSNASPVCGRCTQVCPMKIDIHNHLLRNRRDAVGQGIASTSEKLRWYTWKKFVLHRKTLNRPASIKGFTFKQFFKSEWGEKREFPKIQEKSFNQRWREKMLSKD